MSTPWIIALSAIALVIYAIGIELVARTLTTESKPWRVAAWVAAFTWPIWIIPMIIFVIILLVTGNDT